MTTHVWDRSAPTQSLDEFLKGCYPEKNGQIRLIGNCKDNEEEYRAKDENEMTKYDKFFSKALNYKSIWTDRIDEIKDTAPVRGSKAKGIASQKELRDDAHAQFLKKLKSHALKTDNKAGKWLLFTTSDEYRDSVWKTLSNSFVTGRLSKLPQCCQVKTMSENSESTGFCIYCRDSYNKKEVEEVWRALAEDGLISNAYKCDILTILEIDSTNSNGLKTSEYNSIDFSTKEQTEAYKEAATTARSNQASSGYVPMTSEQIASHQSGNFSVQPPAPQQEEFLEDSDDEQPAKRQKR